ALPNARFDESPRLRVAGIFQILEAQMMGSAVDPVDDCIGSTLQLVVKATRYKPADNRVFRSGVVNCQTGGLNPMPCFAHGAVHGFDNVAADREVTQCLFGFGPDRPD